MRYPIFAPSHRPIPQTLVLLGVLAAMGCSPSRPDKGADAQQRAKASAATEASESLAPAATVDAPTGALKRVREATAAIPTSDFTSSKRWDRGKAQVVKYDATRMRYGKERSFELTMVHVKEAFDAELLVKSDTPRASKTFPVIKTNILFTMPTDNYPYNFATNVFVHRHHPEALVKLMNVSSEWCGTTTKYFDLRGEEPMWRYNSYFEGENQGDVALDWPKHGVLEEQLFLLSRAIPHEVGFRQPLKVLSRQITSHAEDPVWREATMTIDEKREVKDASGTAHQAWHVVVEFADGGAPLTYDVTADDARLLVRHTGPSGVDMRLKDSAMWAYWDFSKPSPLQDN